MLRVGGTATADTDGFHWQHWHGHSVEPAANLMYNDLICAESWNAILRTLDYMIYCRLTPSVCRMGLESGGRAGWTFDTG